MNFNLSFSIFKIFIINKVTKPKKSRGNKKIKRYLKIPINRNYVRCYNTNVVRSTKSIIINQFLKIISKKTNGKFVINHSEVKELAESRTMPAGADWPQFEESFYGADRATILIQRSSVVDGTRTRSFSCHSYLWRAAPSSLPLFLVPASTLRGPVCACVCLSL